MVTCFIDTSTLLYPLDERAPAKAATCRAWLSRLRRERRLVMSLQVLNESYWVVTRKPHFAAVRPVIRGHLERYGRWATAPLDSDTLVQAWAIQDRYGAGFWDGLLLASANAAGCTHFLSEDLSDSQRYGRVTVVDPFRHAPEDVLGRAP